MTVIDAAIQGVPEQAKRRLRTVTNHFSVRRGGKKVEPSLESQSSFSSASLEERRLDLVSSRSISPEATDSVATGCVATA